MSKKDNKHNPQISCFGSEDFKILLYKVLENVPKEATEKYCGNNIIIHYIKENMGFFIYNKIRKEKNIIIFGEKVKENDIAHELAHIFLGHNKINPSCKNYKKEILPKIEKEANQLIMKWGYEPTNKYK